MFDQPFSITADRLEASRPQGRFVAVGHVQVRRPGAVLYADRVEFDRTTGLAQAEGHVVAVDEASVMTCDRVTMRIPELFGGIDGARLVIKDKDSVRGLADLAPLPAQHAGHDELIVTADRLERPSRSQVRVSGASFTACDCGEGRRPSWRIWSKSASIDLNSGAWLTLPVFYVLDVPVMALPVMYVPLGPRRTGLLTPRFGYVSNTGFRLGQPVFFALSRSWDMTVEPYYLSQRGAGLDLELRYSPSRTTHGVFRPSVVADLGQYDSARKDWSKSTTLFMRWALAGEHDTRWSQARLRAEFNLMGDPSYQSDFANAFLSRQAEYTRSRVTYEHQLHDNLRLFAGLQLMQDLRPDTYSGVSPAGLRDIRLFSDQINPTNDFALLVGPGFVRYRFADLVLNAAPTPIWEQVGLLGEARLALSAFAAPRPEVGRFVRVDFRPELSLPVDLPRGLVLEPSLAGRFTAWAGRADRVNDDATRLTLVAKTRLFTELTRNFGEVAHRIRPAVEHVIVPGFLGAEVAPSVFDTRDEVDVLGAVHQVRARLDTDLLDSGSGARIAGLQTWLGRNLPFDGRVGTTSELVTQAEVRLGARSWPVTAQLSARTALRLNDPVFTEARATARIADRRGDSLGATWARFDEERPEYMLVGAEELVASGAVTPDQYLPFAQWRSPAADAPLGPERQRYRPWSAFTGLTLSARAQPFEPLTLAFDMTLSFDNEEVINAIYGPDNRPSVVRNTRSMVAYKSPCDCWSAYLSVSTARDREGVQIDFGLDLARLGSVSN